MLKRIHVKGFKSLVDVELELPALAVLVGRNGSGKTNFLEALQMLSRIGTSDSLGSAFDPPHRGRPLEAFHFGGAGLKGLFARDQVGFSIEADLHLSDAVVKKVGRLLTGMMPAPEVVLAGAAEVAPAPLHRDLRYRVEVEAVPRELTLRVADERLEALGPDSEPASDHAPFIERENGRLRLRSEADDRPTYRDLHEDRSVLSQAWYPPHHPHVVAARTELESWLFHQFEPWTRMRGPAPIRPVRRLGPMGEDLASFLHAVKARNPFQMVATQKALRMFVPNMDEVRTEINDQGDVELIFVENGEEISSRVISEGTLRILGLISLSGVREPPSLVGLEEPACSVVGAFVQIIAEGLNTHARRGWTQFVVTNHSPALADWVEEESLLVVRRKTEKTEIYPFLEWGVLGRRNAADMALGPRRKGGMRPSHRILGGDLDA